jgi:hypothetical protein
MTESGTTHRTTLATGTTTDFQGLDSGLGGGVDFQAAIS